MELDTSTKEVEAGTSIKVREADSVERPAGVDAVVNKKKRRRRRKKKKKKKGGNAPNGQTENQANTNTGNLICGTNCQFQGTLLDVNTSTQILKVHLRTNVDSTIMVDGQLLPAVPFRFLHNVRPARRKLLILDLNGLIADIVLPRPLDRISDININGRAIFKRPFYYDFLKFCFEKFDVGVWSSRSKKIIVKVVDYLFGDLKHRLLFCWDMFHCTPTGFKTLENRHKPLVFKELRRLWERHFDNLPWEKGYYNESNTVLLDDSPYKALLNPVNTAVFPFTFRYKDTNDKSLGPGGDLRVYLEGLAVAENVRTYIELNPFGQSAINEQSPLWCFYSQVLSNLSAEPLT